MLSRFVAFAVFSSPRLAQVAVPGSCDQCDPQERAFMESKSSGEPEKDRNLRYQRGAPRSSRVVMVMECLFMFVEWRYPVAGSRRWPGLRLLAS